MARLHEYLARNGVEDSVVVFECVAAGQSGSISHDVVFGKEESSSLKDAKLPLITGEKAKHYRYETRDVAATTINQLAKSHGIDPGFIKIDVEGVKNVVIAGRNESCR